MTIATSTARADYAGDTVSTVFAVPFYFLDGTHLEVVKRDAAGIETVLVKDVHYTVAGAAVPAGGTITMLAAPASGEQLTIRRKVPITQTLDYVANDPFPAESHERGLDKGAMIDQQQAEEISRSLRAPVTDVALASLPRAAGRSGKFLAFDAEGQPMASGGTGVGDSALREDLAGNDGSAAIGVMLPGAGAKRRTLQSVLRDLGVSIRGYDGTDAVALAAAIVAIGGEGTVFFPAGLYNFSDNVSVPPDVLLDIAEGAVLTIESGKTLTVRGDIRAGDYVIFDGAGIVDVNEGCRHLNLAWFAGTSLDAKWDFARRGLINLYPYTAHVPHPRKDDPAAVYVSDGGRERWFWKLDAPMQFDDPENRGEWTIDGHIQATTAMASMFVFSPTNKTEDLIFKTPILLDANSLADECVRINGGARVKFPMQLYTLNCEKAVNVTSTLPVSHCEIADLYCGSPTDTVLYMAYGTTALNGFNVGHIEIDKANGASVYGVKIIGDCRNVDIGSLTYLSDGGDPLLVGVYMEANTAQGASVFGTRIGKIYGQRILTGFQTRAPSGSTRISNVEVGPIFASTTTGDDAADVQWLSHSTIRRVSSLSDITLGSNTLRVSVESPTYNALSNNAGSYNIINGLISETLGIGVLPSTSLTKLFDKIFNPSDGKLYIRVDTTGVAATDFMAVA